MNTEKTMLQEITEEFTAMAIENEQLLRRISQLEQERKEIAEKAWDAGYERGIWDEFPQKHDPEPPTRDTYLSQFDQTKTEGV